MTRSETQNREIIRQYLFFITRLCMCVGVMWCGGGAGVRVPVVVGERGGDVDGEDAEGDGDV